MTITKTHLSLLVLVLLLSFSSKTLSALGLIRINNYLDTEFSVISIINPTGETAKLEILDEGDNLVFSKNISKQACTQEIINFTDTYNGKYYIVVSNKNFTSEEHFELLNNKIIKPVKHLNSDEKVFFRIDNQILYVSRSFVNNNFNLSITDNEGNVIFNEAYIKTITAKRFNISELPIGEYTVELRSGKKEFTYVFQK